ncbi:hypothetical protein AABB24_030571, partial [Solanum stoloniferum]
KLFMAKRPLTLPPNKKNQCNEPIPYLAYSYSSSFTLHPYNFYALYTHTTSMFSMVWFFMIKFVFFLLLEIAKNGLLSLSCTILCYLYTLLFFCITPPFPRS